MYGRNAQTQMLYVGNASSTEISEFLLIQNGHVRVAVARGYESDQSGVHDDWRDYEDDARSRAMMKEFNNPTNVINPRYYVLRGITKIPPRLWSDASFKEYLKGTIHELLGDEPEEDLSIHTR